MARLGSLLAPQTSARPQPRPQDNALAGPGQSQTMNSFEQMLADPAKAAFLMNMTANLLTQQGIASSMGKGLEGVGRFQTADNDMRRQREQEAHDRAQAAARRGGGGASAPEGKDDAAILKRRDELFKLLGGEDALEPAEQTEIMARATAMALSEAGEAQAFQLYNSLSPEERLQFAPELVDIGNFRNLMRGFGSTGTAKAGTPTAPKDSQQNPALSPSGTVGRPQMPDAAPGLVVPGDMATPELPFTNLPAPTENPDALPLQQVVPWAKRFLK